MVQLSSLAESALSQMGMLGCLRSYQRDFVLDELVDKGFASVINERFAIESGIGTGGVGHLNWKYVQTGAGVEMAARIEREAGR